MTVAETQRARHNLPKTQAAVRLTLEILRIEGAVGRAKFASHANQSVIAGHVAALVRREAAKHILDPLVRAAAGIVNTLGREHLDAVLVEQAVEQLFARQPR